MFMMVICIKDKLVIVFLTFYHLILSILTSTFDDKVNDG